MNFEAFMSNEDFIHASSMINDALNQANNIPIARYTSSDRIDELNVQIDSLKSQLSLKLHAYNLGLISKEKLIDSFEPNDLRIIKNVLNEEELELLCRIEGEENRPFGELNLSFIQEIEANAFAESFLLTSITVSKDVNLDEIKCLLRKLSKLCKMKNFLIRANKLFFNILKKSINIPLFEDMLEYFDEIASHEKLNDLKNNFLNHLNLFKNAKEPISIA